MLEAIVKAHVLAHGRLASIKVPRLGKLGRLIGSHKKGEPVAPTPAPAAAAKS